MRQLHFSLRSLMLTILAVAFIVGVGVRLWTLPFLVYTASYPNGKCACMVWRRHTPTRRNVHVKTLRFHPNGQLAFEFCRGKKTYWAPDGQVISFPNWLDHYAQIVLDVDVKEEQPHHLARRILKSPSLPDRFRNGILAPGDRFVFFSASVAFAASFLCVLGLRYLRKVQPLWHGIAFRVLLIMVATACVSWCIAVVCSVLFGDN